MHGRIETNFLWQEIEKVRQFWNNKLLWAWLVKNTMTMNANDSVLFSTCEILTWRGSNYEEFTVREVVLK